MTQHFLDLTLEKEKKINRLKNDTEVKENDIAKKNRDLHEEKKKNDETGNAYNSLCMSEKMKKDDNARI